MLDKSIQHLQLQAAYARRHVVTMVEAGKSGHMGGALSCIDIITALYFKVMNVDPNNPNDPNRDRFILSAGHKAMAQYAVLAQRGYFDTSVLTTYGDLDSVLPGHPNMHKLAGVEASTGALGHGLSIAVGMALGCKLDKSNAKVFVVMGDGELPEGSNWEAFSAAGHYKCNNLITIIDKNHLQISGTTDEIMNMEPLDQRLQSFGWDVIEIDGNNMQEVVDAFSNLSLNNEKPTAIIANTIKGKGLSFAQGNVAYHYWSPDQAQLDQAKLELDATIQQLKEQLQHD